MLRPGYNYRDLYDPLLILEKEDWTEEEWATCREIFGYADEPNVTRIVAHVSRVECWNKATFDEINEYYKSKEYDTSTLKVTYMDIFKEFTVNYPEWVSDVNDWRPYTKPYVVDEFKPMNIIIWMKDGEMKRYDYNTKKLYPVREE